MAYVRYTLKDWASSCVCIPSLTLLKCISLSKMLCSNSQELIVERIRNTDFMVYQAVLSSLGASCIIQYTYCFEYARDDNEKVGYGWRNEDKNKTERIVAESRRRQSNQEQ